MEAIDPFDRVQLEYVVEVCRRSANFSDAGRSLFTVSRKQRASTNDSDRLRKYLAKFELDCAPSPNDLNGYDLSRFSNYATQSRSSNSKALELQCCVGTSRRGPELTIQART